MFVYRIYNKELSKYWTSPAGKTLWLKAHYAQMAWNCACSWGSNGTFNDNPHLEVHKFALVRMLQEDDNE